MKVLVTGGNGFIGSYTVERLLAKNYEVMVLSNQKYFYDEQEGVSFFYGDIRDEVAVSEAMAHAEAWIHLAGVLGTAETIQNPKPAAWTNIVGGLNIFNAAAHYKVPGVNIAVGNHWENNTYSITKSTMERFATMYNSNNGTEITILRALNAYGPRQTVAAPYGDSKVRKIMPSFVCRALLNDPIQIYGDGNQIMDMVYVDDVASCLVGALEYTVDHGHVPHVLEAGSGNKTTVNDIANKVVDISHSKTVIEHIPMRPGETPGAVVLGDPSTLDILHSYGVNKENFIDLDTGISETVDYFRNYLQNRGMLYT